MIRNELSIGALSRRTGVAVSAIRFYEEKGLLRSARNRGGQRRFLRSDIRRVSLILIVQQFGLTLAEIRDLLASIPQDKVPTARQWASIGERLGAEVERRIATLTRLQNRLDGCIGCGCLSLDKCALYNPEDRAGRHGTGPRFVLEGGEAGGA